MLPNPDQFHNRRRARNLLHGPSVRRKDPHRKFDQNPKPGPNLLLAPLQPQGPRQRLVPRLRLQSLLPLRALSLRKKKSATDRRRRPSKRNRIPTSLVLWCNTRYTGEWLMPRLHLLSALLLLLASGLAAQQKPTAAPSATSPGLPPLIDRDLFFGKPRDSRGASLPPRKESGVSQTMERYAKCLGQESGRAVQRRAFAHHGDQADSVAGYLWSRDGKYVIYVKDNDGDENFNLYAVDPNAPAGAGSEAPPSRDLTGLKGTLVQPYSVPKNDPDVIYIGLNDRDKAWHDLYKTKNLDGRAHPHPEEHWRRSQRGFSMRAASCVWHSGWADNNGDQELLRVDPAWFHESVFVHRF